MNSAYKISSRLPCVYPDCIKLTFNTGLNKPLCCEHWNGLPPSIRTKYYYLAKSKRLTIIQRNRMIQDYLNNKITEQDFINVE